MSPDTTIGAATRDVTPSAISRPWSSAGTPGSSVARRAGAPVRATSASALPSSIATIVPAPGIWHTRLAPLADDDPFVQGRAEANEVRGVGAEEASHLLGHDVEDPLRCRLGRDRHRDAVQGRLLRDERAEVDLVLRHAEIVARVETHRHEATALLGPEGVERLLVERLRADVGPETVAELDEERLLDVERCAALTLPAGAIDGHCVRVVRDTQSRSTR